MNRRTFMKGAVVAASTPAVALAPAGTYSIGGLIADHAVADEMYYAADKREGEISKDPARPPYPHIRINDFGPYYHGGYVNSKTLYSESEIEKLFDNDFRTAEFNAGFFSTAEYAKRMTAIAARKERALESFRAQSAHYDLWAETSGYRKAGEETARIARVVGKIEDKILSHRCECLEEVRAKAVFFDRVYGKTAPEGFVDAFVKSLIA